jgi:hypothetical protein
MAYTAEISRSNPSCLLFLIDQSGSMKRPFGGQTGKRKADGVADAVNRMLQNLALKCAKSEGIRDYFHVGVIGYATDINLPLGGPLAGQPLVPISLLANHPLRIEQRKRRTDDGAGGLVEQTFKFPVWLEPVADGKTAMCKALKLAGQFVDEFITQFPSCFPPLVINISDGRATDGDPTDPADELRQRESNDGNVLVFNVHLSSRSVQPVEYPGREEVLSHRYARLLYRLSSPLPTVLRDAARAEGFDMSGTPRGFVFNADLVAVIRFLDIGTRLALIAR